MRVLLVLENSTQHEAWQSAWDYISERICVGGITISGMYLANEPLTFAEKFPVKNLALLREKRNGKPVYDATIVIGALSGSDMYHFMFCLHQLYLGDVFIIDPSFPEDQPVISPHMYVSHYCKDSEKDIQGLVKDIIWFFAMLGNPYFKAGLRGEKHVS